MPNGSVCLRAHTPPTSARSLTTPFGLDWTNFTLLHTYSVANGTVTLNHSVCEDVCGTDCAPLGVATFPDWNAVYTSNQCLTVPTLDGIHADDPYIYQRVSGLDGFASAHPGVFPSLFTSTVPPITEPPIGEGDSGDDVPWVLYGGIAGGVTVLIVLALAVYFNRVTTHPRRTKVELRGVAETSGFY